MPAPKGNRFWEARYNHGRKPKTKSPETLWEAAVKYFEWVQENPLLDSQVIPFQGEGYDHPVPKMRAPTLQGLWVFLGISHTTWQNWKKREDGFLAVQERIESVLYDWKFSGAAAGLLNASIIARDLKLKDHADLTSDGEAISDIVLHFDGPKSRTDQ